MIAVCFAGKQDEGVTNMLWCIKSGTVKGWIGFAVTEGVWEQRNSNRWPLCRQQKLNNFVTMTDQITFLTRATTEECEKNDAVAMETIENDRAEVYDMRLVIW